MVHETSTALLWGLVLRFPSNHAVSRIDANVLRYGFVLCGHTRARNHPTSCLFYWSMFDTEITTTLRLLKVFNLPFTLSQEGMPSI